MAPLNEAHRQDKVDERLSAAVDALVSDAKSLGVTEDALLALIKAKY